MKLEYFTSRERSEKMHYYR